MLENEKLIKWLTFTDLLFLSTSFVVFFLTFIYLFILEKEREREGMCVSGGGSEREGNRELEAGSTPSAQSPTRVPDCQSHPGTPLPARCGVRSHNTTLRERTWEAVSGAAGGQGEGNV